MRPGEGAGRSPRLLALHDLDAGATKVMAGPLIEELQRRIAKLGARVEQLLNRSVEPRIMLDVIGPQARSRMINSMSAAEVGPHLRAVALRCARLSHESADARAAQELQDAGVELADRASRLEAVLQLA